MTDRKGAINGLNDTIYYLRLRECKSSEICIEHQRNAIEYINAQPDIIRCKDCVHWDELTQACDEIDGIFLPDWFCADGERKSADEILMEEMDADPLG